MTATKELSALFTIRPYQAADYAALATVIEASYDFSGDDVVPTRQQVNLLSNLYPNGQLTAWVADQLVGAILCRKVPVDQYGLEHTETMAFDINRYVADAQRGDALYVLDYVVRPGFRHLQLGKALRRQFIHQAFADGMNCLIGLSRISGFHQYQTQFSVEEYVQKVIAKELTDPVLSFHLHLGVQIKGIVYNFCPHDSKSSGHAVLTQVVNPHRRNDTVLA